MIAIRPKFVFICMDCGHKMVTFHPVYLGKCPLCNGRMEREPAEKEKA